MTQQDACTRLDTDRQKVERLFTEYQSAPNASRKSQLAQETCMELTVHAIIEEEIFYPAYLAATRGDKRVEEAQEEHQQAKDLIAAIEDGDKIDALIARLQKAIEYHVKDERTEMFPKARKSPPHGPGGAGRAAGDAQAGADGELPAGVTAARMTSDSADLLPPSGVAIGPAQPPPEPKPPLGPQPAPPGPMPNPPPVS